MQLGHMEGFLLQHLQDTLAMHELMMSNKGLEYRDNYEQHEQGYDENEHVHGSTNPIMCCSIMVLFSSVYNKTLKEVHLSLRHVLTHLLLQFTLGDKSPRAVSNANPKQPITINLEQSIN